MGFFNKLFKKKEVNEESGEEVHTKRRHLMKEIIKGIINWMANKCKLKFGVQNQ